MVKPVQSVERAAAMLQLLASESDPLALGEIAAATGLPKGTAHGLLATLVGVGLVAQDPAGRYRPGDDLLHIGTVRLDLNELKSRAINWTDALAARTGEAARVAAFRDGAAVVAHHVFRPDARAQKIEIGTRLPLHASALGKVLLAFDPGAARSVAGATLTSYTYRTLTDRAHLVPELADIRDAGWAASVGEFDADLAGIAAPLRDRGGYVIGAVGIAGRSQELCDTAGHPRTEMVTEVLHVARAISREFGHGRVA